MDINTSQTRSDHSRRCCRPPVCAVLNVTWASLNHCLLTGALWNNRRPPLWFTVMNGMRSGSPTCSGWTPVFWGSSSTISSAKCNTWGGMFACKKCQFAFHHLHSIYETRQCFANTAYRECLQGECLQTPLKKIPPFCEITNCVKHISCEETGGNRKYIEKGCAFWSIRQVIYRHYFFISVKTWLSDVHLHIEHWLEIWSRSSVCSIRNQ